MLKELKINLEIENDIVNYKRKSNNIYTKKTNLKFNNTDNIEDTINNTNNISTICNKNKLINILNLKNKYKLSYNFYNKNIGENALNSHNLNNDNRCIIYNKSKDNTNIKNKNKHYKSTSQNVIKSNIFNKPKKDDVNHSIENDFNLIIFKHISPYKLKNKILQIKNIKEVEIEKERKNIERKERYLKQELYKPVYIEDYFIDKKLISSKKTLYNLNVLLNSIKPKITKLKQNKTSYDFYNKNPSLFNKYSSEFINSENIKKANINKSIISININKRIENIKKVNNYPTFKLLNNNNLINKLNNSLYLNKYYPIAKEEDYEYIRINPIKKLKYIRDKKLQKDLSDCLDINNSKSKSYM